LDLGTDSGRDFVRKGFLLDLSLGVAAVVADSAEILAPIDLVDSVDSVDSVDLDGFAVVDTDSGNEAGSSHADFTSTIVPETPVTVGSVITGSVD